MLNTKSVFFLAKYFFTKKELVLNVCTASRSRFATRCIWLQENIFHSSTHDLHAGNYASAGEVILTGCQSGLGYFAPLPSKTTLASVFSNGTIKIT